jgi:cytochrome c553
LAVPLAPASAQQPAPDPASDAAAKRLYLTKTCIACHGRDGKKPIQNYPVLAGQREDYLKAQLEDILASKRIGSADETGNPRTHGMRGALIAPDGQRRITAEESVAIARWLAAQQPDKAATENPVPPERVTEGLQFFNRTCRNCHGPEGKKPVKGYPMIGGQKRAYIIAQVKDIRAKARTNGRTATMAPFIAKVTDEQIELVADYLSQLDPASK